MEIIDCDTGQCVLYQIKSGDNLNDLLHKFDNCKIIRNNPSIELYEGEVIKIVKQVHKLHIVKPMETLDIVAKQYNTSAERLIELNNLSSKRLFIGQTLIIDNKN